MSIELSEIEAKVAELFAAEIGFAGPLPSQFDLVDDAELESVQIMEVIVEIEDLYDIAIDLDGLSKVRTINELANLVRSIIEG